MKTNNLLGKVAAFVIIVMIGLNVSCKNDETLNGADATNAVSETLTDGYYEDADDISLVAAGTAPSPARVATDDDRLMCNGDTNVTFLDGSNATSGGFVVNFGSGCTDSRGSVRSGEINVTYSGGPIGNEGFKIVITFLNYSINGIKLEGTRTITKLSSSEIKHSISLKDGKATWPDESYATREASFTRTVNVNDLTVTLDGSASGSNRDGKSYTMEITKPLVYKASCAVINKIFMAVEGTKLFTNTDTNRTLTIDYGDGTCDKAITLGVGGKSYSYTVRK